MANLELSHQETRHRLSAIWYRLVGAAALGGGIAMAADTAGEVARLGLEHLPTWASIDEFAIAPLVALGALCLSAAAEKSREADVYLAQKLSHDRRYLRSDK